MATRIEVNGVAYDSVEAMPPDVRRVYEETMARAAEMSERAGEGVPAVIQHGGISMRSTIRKRFVVNGQEYDDESAMPPDVRRIYDDAMRAAASGATNVKRNDLKISFQITGPGFHFGKSTETPDAASPATGSPSPGARPIAPLMGLPAPRPIEPASAAGSLRLALVLGACAVGGVLLWYLTRAR
jgi:hypothetical protein